ncbi:hypothetical protein VB716_11830 [Synechococcus sp. CCY9201]|uniref:hypothetical protein n=1 Tax=unclassified Synechococcus TaxID=2626047 RepID=UPI002AD3E7F8|nr:MULTISPECIES: hypothetical protein [unclassified Synechococcus]MEA5421930.1 hypothetical protein [Synechococcus sp. CCY9202]MEA5474908.1 hypothetical protein [Synechococcus sp. CCY9201]CAK6699278.1 hypothetical protein IFHNHDMJ_02602 [Synechococcus sp. CBW1107]
MPSSQPSPSSQPIESAKNLASPEHPHNFEAQKEVHQQIRNDPDYDDWEYGTEPLPHEAWIAARERGAAAVPDSDPGAGGTGV